MSFEFANLCDSDQIQIPQEVLLHSCSVSQDLRVFIGAEAEHVMVVVVHLSLSQSHRPAVLHELKGASWHAVVLVVLIHLSVQN